MMLKPVSKIIYKIMARFKNSTFTNGLIRWVEPKWVDLQTGQSRIHEFDVRFKIIEGETCKQFFLCVS